MCVKGTRKFWPVALTCTDETTVRHVQSHVLVHECDDPFEESNAKADAAAGVADLCSLQILSQLQNFM